MTDLLTFNGQPIILAHEASLVSIDGRPYLVEYAATDECSCRRCLWHEDFGGCIVAEFLWYLACYLAGAVSLDSP